MYRKEVNERSPLRLLDQSLHGGLGPGNLGLVLARAGVGKTAFLVQLGLDDLLRDRKVLHVSLDADIDEVLQWYDELFADLSEQTQLADPVSARLLVERNRMVQVYRHENFSADRLGSVMGVLKEHALFEPAAILVDGLDWSTTSREEVAALKNLAAEFGAELWATALTHRHLTREAGQMLPPPYESFDDEINVAVFLQPNGNRVDLRLVRDHDSPELGATTLELEPVTLRLTDTSVDRVDEESGPRPRQFTLFSGGAPGAEEAFGAAAQKHGVREVNFTFPGHSPARSTGHEVLSEQELRRGDVSLAYVSRRMSRTFNSSPGFRRVLQSIWHQVNRSQQVLVVGVIQPDGTVRGGTGWGAELARVWNKPLWVFDQEQEGWFRWDGSAQTWESCPRPALTAHNVCGTGTRFLSDAGRAEIESVFEETFSGA